MNDKENPQILNCHFWKSQLNKWKAVFKKPRNIMRYGSVPRVDCVLYQWDYKEKKPLDLYRYSGKQGFREIKIKRPTLTPYQ